MQTVPRRRGRPPTGNQAMTVAQRKREQRLRLATKVNGGSDSGLTDAECLAVLANNQWPKGSAIDKDAWRQLGKLRGYL
ncbi:MAG: hypothetical protein ORN29_09270 [Rhodoferax sp.]|nr:hypothetical protein [Rhodoferax sp.]